MIDKGRNILPRAAQLVVGLGVAAAAIGAGHAGSSSGPVECEIQATSSNGMISLQGVVHASAAISGSYSFRVESAGGGGSTDIRQGGAFTAGPGGPATLGQVMLGSRGAIYDASLEVTADGVTVKCADRVGGAI